MHFTILFFESLTFPLFHGAALLPDPSKRQTFEDIRVALAPYASK
jgi:hypothetical protein